MTEAWIDLSIKLPQGSRENFHLTWSEYVQDEKLHVKTHAIKQILYRKTNVVNGRVQPLHTRHVKRITSQIMVYIILHGLNIQL